MNFFRTTDTKHTTDTCVIFTPSSRHASGLWLVDFDPFCRYNVYDWWKFWKSRINENGGNPKKRLNNSSNDLDLKKHYQLLHWWGYQTIKVTRAATPLTQGQHLVTIRTMGVKFCNGSVFASGLSFAPRWMKNSHELFKPITKHSDWNRVIFIWKPFYFKIHEKNHVPRTFFHAESVITCFVCCLLRIATKIAKNQKTGRRRKNEKPTFQTFGSVISWHERNRGLTAF